jgi:putative effector of murein hydrolase
VSDVSGIGKKLGMPDNPAIPLHAQLGRLKRLALPLLVALLVGPLSSALSTVAIGSLSGASRVTLLSRAPKSVTTPIAMARKARKGLRLL